MLWSFQCRAEAFHWLTIVFILAKHPASWTGALVATVSVLANMGAATLIFLTLVIIRTHPLVWQKVKAFVARAGMSALLVMTELVTTTISLVTFIDILACGLIST